MECAYIFFMMSDAFYSGHIDLSLLQTDKSLVNIELCVCIFGVVVLFSFTSLSRLFHSYRGFDPHSGRHVVYLFRLPLNAKLYA